MKIKILALLLAFFFGISLYAQNSNDALRISEPGYLGSARSIGMGNALSAYGGDFSSIMFNPAGLGLYNSSELSISGFNNNYKNNTLFYNNSLTNSLDAANFSQFGIVYKLPVSRGSLVLAVGYNRLKDFNRIVQFSGYNPENNSMIQDLTAKRSDFAYEAGVSYGLTTTQDATLINGRLQQSGKTSEEGGIDNWSLAGAMEVQQNLFVGVTLNVLSGKFDRRREYTESDPFGIYSSVQLDPADVKTLGFKSFTYNDAISWDISGWDMTLGFIYKLKQKATIGASIHLPKYFTIKENYRLSSIGDFANQTFNVLPSVSKFEYEITTPWEFSAGGSYNVDRLLLAAEIKYIDYTQMKFTSGLESEAERDNINWGIKDDFRSVFNYNLGAEYSLYEMGIKLRAGIMIMKSPYKNDTSEYDKKFVTGGVGIPFDQMEINMGVAYGWWKDFGYNYESASRPVEHDIKSTTLMVSLKYNF